MLSYSYIYSCNRWVNIIEPQLLCYASIIINPRRACAARVTVVGSFCLSVCLSVKSHLTYGASVRPENAVTYSAGNEGQNICGVFSETTEGVLDPCNGAVSEKTPQIF